VNESSRFASAPKKPGCELAASGYPKNNSAEKTVMLHLTVLLFTPCFSVIEYFIELLLSRSFPASQYQVTAITGGPEAKA